MRNLYVDFRNATSNIDTLPQPEELTFKRSSNYSNYGCHYVPVVSYGGFDYRPPKQGSFFSPFFPISFLNYTLSGGMSTFDEIVIFNEAHILPHALVSLKTTVEAKIVATPTPPKVKEWSCDEVIAWMKSLHLSCEYHTPLLVYFYYLITCELQFTSEKKP